MDAALEKVRTARHGLPPMMHRVIYVASEPNMPLRRLAVEFAVWRWDTDYLKKQRTDGAWRGSEAWAGFWMDLGISLHETKERAVSGKPPYEEADACAYHEHRITGTPCYKTRSRC